MIKVSWIGWAGHVERVGWIYVVQNTNQFRALCEHGNETFGFIKGEVS
jgi:hypothetical protein